jgi:DNA repair ATPase RecN
LRLPSYRPIQPPTHNTNTNTNTDDNIATLAIPSTPVAMADTQLPDFAKIAAAFKSIATQMPIITRGLQEAYQRINDQLTALQQGHQALEETQQILQQAQQTQQALQQDLQALQQDQDLLRQTLAELQHQFALANQRLNNIEDTILPLLLL